MYENRLQTFERFFLNSAAVDFTTRSLASAAARAIFVNELSALSHAGNIHECRQRERSIEVVISVNLVRRDQHLWSSIAVALVNADVINGDYGFESKLDLGPDDTVVPQLQFGL